MKKYLVIAALCIASIAKATTTSNPSSCATPTDYFCSGPIYYCNVIQNCDVRDGSDWSDYCDQKKNNCNLTPGCGNTPRGHSGDDDCGGTTTHQAPDAASSLGLFSSALALVGFARRKFAALK